MDRARRNRRNHMTKKVIWMMAKALIKECEIKITRRVQIVKGNQRRVRKVNGRKGIGRTIVAKSIHIMLLLKAKTVGKIRQNLFN